MKKLTLILAMFLSVMVIGQTTKLLPKIHSARIEKKTKENDSIVKNIDKVTPDVLKKAVLNSDTVAKLQSKTIAIAQDSIVKTNQQLKNAISQDLYGGVKPIHFFIAYFFALLGMMIRWGLTVRVTIKTNTDVQVKFSWRTWVFGSVHKIMRVMALLGLVFVFLRFSKEMLGYELSMLVAVGIGFFIDFLADKVMKINPESILKSKMPIIADSSAGAIPPEKPKG